MDLHEIYAKHRWEQGQEGQASQLDTEPALYFLDEILALKNLNLVPAQLAEIHRVKLAFSGVRLVQEEAAESEAR